jgi:hypothetical protein
MPIVRLLEREAFRPEDIKVITVAFEDTLAALQLIDRLDPLTEMVAKKIIECVDLLLQNADRSLRFC